MQPKALAQAGCTRRQMALMRCGIKTLFAAGGIHVGEKAS
jgi:hypothetical protein